jgi:TldD protein
MADTFDIVMNELLSGTELSFDHFESLLGECRSPGVDYADVYAQAAYCESWYLEEGIVKDGSFDYDKGVGVRVNSGEKTGFAYSDDLALSSLLETAKAANCIARGSAEQKQAAAIHSTSFASKYPGINPINSLSSQEKIDLLHKVDAHARGCDKRVIEVSASLSGSYETILILATDGTLASDVRPLVRMDVKVLVEDKGVREQGVSGGGLRGSYQYFLDNDKAIHYADEAVRQALVSLEAIPAPAGTMPVVLAPGWPGILLHEAIGHGLEADFNRKGTSAFTGLLGEKISSEKCTIVDDGSLENRRGSLNVDDEGTEAACTTLIEKGVLKTYMNDKLNARLMNRPLTGNARRESYAHIPMPRMTNTYMLPGDDDPEEIIQSVKKGIYAVNFSGGQVDITSGKFVFSASEAYLIENGKVTVPIKGATLIGSGDEVLKKVSMVGNDLRLDSGVGVCGKDGQSVPVGVGQPTVKVDELVVGGTVKEA